MVHPLVSILIPSYNHSDYIVETLNSTLEDMYKNKEIVIIDDGSKDNSADVIEQWIIAHPDQKINFKKRGNKGLCATLNELVEMAEGKYGVLLASDDVLINNTIGERVKILENSNKKVLVSDAVVIDDKGEKIYDSMLSDFHKADKSKYVNDDELMDQIIFKFSISGAVVMMDLDIFKLIGKYPEDLKAEDLYFYTSAAAKGDLLFYDRYVSKYRIHDFNTSKDNPEILKSFVKTYKRLLFKIPGFKRKIKVCKLIYLYQRFFLKKKILRIIKNK